MEIQAARTINSLDRTSENQARQPARRDVMHDGADRMISLRW
jgi:hypothetical protein